MVKEVKKRNIEDGARGYCIPKSPAKPCRKVGARAGPERIGDGKTG